MAFLHNFGLYYATCNMDLKTMIIRKEKALFPQDAKFLGVLLLIFSIIGMILETYNNPKPLDDFLSTAWPFLIIMVVGLAIILARDEFEFDFDQKQFISYAKLFGVRFFMDTKKLPDEILFVQTVHRKLKWRRYFAAAIPMTTNIITYEVYLVSKQGKAAKLTSLEEKEAKEFSAKIADLYGVEWRLKERV